MNNKFTPKPLPPIPGSNNTDANSSSSFPTPPKLNSSQQQPVQSPPAFPAPQPPPVQEEYPLVEPPTQQNFPQPPNSRAGAFALPQPSQYPPQNLQPDYDSAYHNEATNNGYEEEQYDHQQSASNDNYYYDEDTQDDEYYEDKPLNKLALISIIGVWFINLVGIICGHLALKQIKETGEKGKGLALTGLIVGYISFLFSILAIIFVPTMLNNAFIEITGLPNESVEYQDLTENSDSTENVTTHLEYLYETDSFTVLLPGEPELMEMDNPNPGGPPMSMAIWENDPLSAYLVSYIPEKAADLSLESSTLGAIEGANAELVNIKSFPIEGGEGMIAEGDMMGHPIWFLVVFSDTTNEQFMVYQGGGEYDAAYFDSLTLK